MKKDLVIVESPTKAKTIKRYLGKGYAVASSLGHIKDLPTDRLGVDIENDFQPRYEVIRGREKIIAQLRKLARDAKAVYLAPDPDREGEAIAWHIAEEIKNKRKENIYRIIFHEVTKKAIEKALTSPGRLNKALYEAQQARRVLDRLVGYKISPLLWKKVKGKLSAGRVQSVALRLICEREEKRRNFIPEEYWELFAIVKSETSAPFKLKLEKIKGKKAKIADEPAVQQIMADLKTKTFTVMAVICEERIRYPTPPFTTSTLQQEAGRKLNFPVKKTMNMAQQLYEGIDLGEKGPVGLITYMRTDSVRVAKSAIFSVRKFLADNLGKDYVPERPNFYKNKKTAQDAHEAIRPTSMELSPEVVKPYLNKGQLTLYQLIWNRFVASQAKPAIYDYKRIEVVADKHYELAAEISQLRFPGFLKVYEEGEDEEPDQGEAEIKRDELPEVNKGETLALKSLEPEQHFTRPPAPYRESMLVKDLESKGIGRPSTYASIVSTIQERNYVIKERGALKSTELGEMINKLLIENFPEVMDVKFTAMMEDELDKVEEGNVNWTELLRNFYSLFQRRLEEAQDGMQYVKSQQPPTQVKCEKCGANMVIRWGKRGRFLACPNYPECRNTKEYVDTEDGGIKVAEEIVTDLACEKCGRNLVVRVSKRGRFLACPGFPNCRNSKPLITGVICPNKDCGGQVVERRSRRGRPFYVCANYPKCNFISWEAPIRKGCPRCGCNFTLLVEEVDRRVLKCHNIHCGFKEYLD